MKPVHSNIQLSGDYLNYQDNPLWIRIANYAIDDANAVIPFSKKIAQTEDWTKDFTEAAILEYKRFVYLCCISENGASPSIVVDKVWHMHLLYTTEYWKNFCPSILQRELHHFPNVGGIIDYNKHQDWYLETLILYIRVFKQNPPAKFWRIPPELKSFLQPEPGAPTKNSFQYPPTKVYYLLILAPFLFSWMLFGSFPIPDLPLLQYLLLFLPLILIISWVTARYNKDHLQPNIEKIPQYNRYQLAWLTGGYDNAFLLLVNDLEESNWIKIIDTKGEFKEKFFSLNIASSEAINDRYLTHSQSLFECFNQLPQSSKFSLSQLNLVLSTYLNAICRVETAAKKSQSPIFLLFLIVLATMIWFFPTEETGGFAILLLSIFFVISFCFMIPWIFLRNDQEIMATEIKKQVVFLNGINTLNQKVIILNQFNGISDSSFFKKVGNYFGNHQACGARQPDNTGCGC